MLHFDPQLSNHFSVIFREYGYVNAIDHVSQMFKTDYQWFFVNI